VDFLITLTDFFILSTFLLGGFTVVASLGLLITKIVPEKYTNKILDIFPTVSGRN
jgi:hypothetical protein